MIRSPGLRCPLLISHASFSPKSAVIHCQRSAGSATALALIGTLKLIIPCASAVKPTLTNGRTGS